MKLTGQRVQQICDALSDAYPTRDALRMLLRLDLDENLEEIAGGENHSVVVFNLVTWAERSGRIDELITRAQRRMSGNETLRQLAAEWEKACRGEAGGIYPWGDAAPTADRANFFPNTGGTMPVGSYSPQGDSPYGVADMAGNVWEWTSSQPLSYPYAAEDGREDPVGEGKRVLRGGAWYLSADYVRCASRFSFGENYGYYDFGFRVVMADG